ncbi:Adrenodoxin, mitochondrial [Dermatophagoides pteronyssinus]|uniref:Adrenodoxin-like n=2 Tax=Dermatophagoides pteronyssinus TaxID=6956 RepID=A0A6P6XPG8_DERPT|nr:adrenodoxin-like [Dermatophagoides pteronyssinus]KAH9425615.1 Adrenodoxin, mitochondrial [Dermatophagoides pteronyssinus]
MMASALSLATNISIFASRKSILFHSKWFLSKRLLSSTPGMVNNGDARIRQVKLDSDKNKPKPKPNLKVTFELDDGRELIGKACDGDTLLDVVLNNELDLDGFGACEGTLACSTCHLVFSQEDFDRIPNKITDEEMDMLDLAYGLTETSRLGCQIYITKEFDGLRVKVPPAVNDVRLR